MFKKSFLCLLLAATTSFAFANSIFTPVTRSSNSLEIAPPCDLPAPNNPHYEERGPNWLVFKWSAVTPFVSHRVKTYTVVGNNLVGDVVAAAGQQSVKVTGLLQGVAYYSTVNAICPDGTDSDKIATGTPDTTIVSELVVSGFSSSPSPASCGVSGPNQFCYFNLNGIYNYFKIRQISNHNNGRQFVVVKENNELRGFVTTVGGAYTFKIDQNDPTPAGVQGVNFEIYFGEDPDPMAVFQLSEKKVGGATLGKLTCQFMTSGYEIVRLSPPPPGGMLLPPTEAPTSNERNEKTSAEWSVSASPNPFSETLEVFLTKGSVESVNLQLVNLSGQVVLDRQFVSKQEQYTLPTTGLSPGFYFLRIEADGVVQTLKVVKSE